MSKKTVFILSLIGTGIFAFAYSQKPHPVYGEFGYQYDLMERLVRWTIFFVPTLLISASTYSLRQEVFQLWGKVAVGAFILNVLLLLFLPESNGNISILPTPGDTAVFMAEIFFVTSSVIVVYKSYSLKRKNS